MARKPSNGYSDIGGRDSQRVPDITGINAERLVDVLDALLNVGEALVIGGTRNGSAIRVQIYSGDDKPDWYLKDADEFDGLMLEILTYHNKTSR